MTSSATSKKDSIIKINKVAHRADVNKWYDWYQNLAAFGVSAAQDQNPKSHR